MFDIFSRLDTMHERDGQTDAILSQSGKKIDRKCGPEFGGLLWPSDATQKNRNIGAQLQSLTCIIAPKMFRKIYFLCDFWCAQTCSF